MFIELLLSNLMSQVLSNCDYAKRFQQLVFIYNAITNGWEVRDLGNGFYEFEKDLAEIPSKYKNQLGTDVKDSFLFKFLKNNMTLECRIPTNNQHASIGFY